MMFKHAHIWIVKMYLHAHLEGENYLAQPQPSQPQPAT